MKPKFQTKIGSSYFFQQFEDYKIKDNDELCILDGKSFNTRKPINVLNMKLNGNDVFFYRDMTKDEFINDTKTCNVPMRVGKFLIPEFCEYLNITIDDLKGLRYIFNDLDSKHQYETIICDAYISNNDFFLTDEQRSQAYEAYKSARQE